MEYILTWGRSHIELIGPFPIKEAAIAWVGANNPHDTPCWQLITLDPDFIVYSDPDVLPRPFYPTTIRTPDSSPLLPYEPVKKGAFYATTTDDGGELYLSGPFETREQAITAHGMHWSIIVTVDEPWRLTLVPGCVCVSVKAPDSV